MTHGEYYCVCGKKLPKAFCGSRRSCVKSDKLPQVMSLESASVGLRSTSLKMKKIWGSAVRKIWAYHISVACSSSLVATRGYISRYWHNTPKPPTELSVVELHCGQIRCHAAYASWIQSGHLRKCHGILTQLPRLSLRCVTPSGELGDW